MKVTEAAPKQDARKFHAAYACVNRAIVEIDGAVLRLRDLPGRERASRILSSISRELRETRGVLFSSEVGRGEESSPQMHER